jgi:methylated-DNA-[protein]-cysteine S-methyltransferase
MIDIEQQLREAALDLPGDPPDVTARAEEEGLLDVAFASVDSPLGPLMVAATPKGLVRVSYTEFRGDDEVLEDLARMVSPRVLEAPGRLDGVRRELDEYFEGRRHHFDVPVDWALTAPGFRSRALHAVARIPYGKTKTYAEIAKSAGNERAFRAAGTACGRNPIPLIVPCHRVVQSGGGIGNYGGGPEMKRALLDLEGAR